MPAWLSDIVDNAHALLTTAPITPETQLVVDYLSGRGVTKADILEYKIGLASPSSFVISKCTPQFHDWSQRYLWNKIVFPLTDIAGDVIGVQTRALEDPESGPRYQQFYCYPQEIQPYFFGLHQAIDTIFLTNQVVIVEGVFDYFAVKNSAPNTLAILTSGVPHSSKVFFRRYVKRIFSALDMDKSGRESTERLASWASSNGIVVQALTYSKKDPGELAMAGRLVEIEALLKASQQVV